MYLVYSARDKTTDIITKFSVAGVASSYFHASHRAAQRSVRRHGPTADHPRSCLDDRVVLACRDSILLAAHGTVVLRTAPARRNGTPAPDLARAAFAVLTALPSNTCGAQHEQSGCKEVPQPTPGFWKVPLELACD